MKSREQKTQRKAENFHPNKIHMRTTSFGKLDLLLGNKEDPIIEHLVFEGNGRGHSHDQYESFFVLKGEGKVISGDQEHIVQPGSLVTIPPNTIHWMEPKDKNVLEGFLWYHDTPLSINPQTDEL